MKFSYNWFKIYFGKKTPSPEKLAELIGLHAFEIEGLEKIGDDFAIDIDILPNRPDCLSHNGLIRELSAILNQDVKFDLPKVKEDKKNLVNSKLSVKVMDKNACPRYCARVLNNIVVKDSPAWLKNYLQTCGIRSINNIVDAANYVMLEIGQPLHCFDFDKLAGRAVQQTGQAGEQKKEIIVRNAVKGEKIACLDDKTYQLQEKHLVIADSSKALAIAGIKGGKAAEIDKSTKNIIIESANFNQYLIRATSHDLALRTDASIRYEHGVDIEKAESAVNRLAELILDIAQGKSCFGFVDTNKPKSKPLAVRLFLNKIEEVLGAPINEKDATNALKRLGFNVKKSSKGSLDVFVPSFRTDIEYQEDLIEEIARIYGYEKIEAKFPKTILATVKKQDKFIWPHILREEMKSLGWFEAWNYSFIGDNDVSNFGLDDRRLISLDNPLSNEFNTMRPTQIIGLCKNIAYNQNYTNNLRFYEIGKKFNKGGGLIDPLTDEKIVFSGVCAGKDIKEAFLEAKHGVESALEGLGIAQIKYTMSSDGNAFPWFESSNMACVVADGEIIGLIGPIKESAKNKMKLNQSLVGFELDFDKMCRLADSDQEYEEISKFPAIIRDISVVVSQDILIDDILCEIQKGANAFVRDVELFDIFENEEKLPGKKSLSFHVVLQSKEKTLTSQDADNVLQNIIARLESKNWEIRKAK